MEEKENAKSWIPEITKSIPTIEAQLREAFTIKKEVFSSNFRSDVNSI
tara:strand:+ start:336 stop:479 length:144 start_codon:yes stop_codon:yes gene_type:complete